MIKHYIDGTEKVEKDCKDCKICEGDRLASMFMEKRIHKHAPRTDEIICRECNTKYKKDLKDADKLIDKDCDHCNHYNDIDQSCNNDEELFLCMGNYESFEKKIYEVDNMDIVEKKADYIVSGKCTDHAWIDSKPFKTSSGTYTIKSCRVCKHAEVKIGTHTYEGDIFCVLKDLSERGIKSEIDKSFDNIAIEEVKTDKETILISEIENLFGEEKEESEDFTKMTESEQAEILDGLF